MTISTTVKAVRGSLLAAALLAGAAAPAQAASPGFPPSDWLYLTVTKGDARSPHTRDTLLLCDPPQGHARAVDACSELAAADGDIARIPSKKNVFCPMIYAPVTVHARGEWNGRPVEYTQTFSSSCVMAGRTGSVFAMDN